MNEFLWALAIIFHLEGGWTEIDGGTNFGITAATLANANRQQIVLTRDIRNITRREAAVIYYHMFWRESRAYRYPYPLNLVMFDAAVHTGPGRARNIMDTARRNSPPNASPRQVAREFVRERYRRLTKLRNYQTFGRGWRRRMQIIMAHVNDTRPRRMHVAR